MSEFDKIIGYDTIKEELKQLCDMIHNASIYEKLGAKMSKGLLLHGEPGVGKSLMARSFIKESNRNAYVIRRNKPDGDFINEIKRIFTEAAENAPSIIILDDMDKFVVEEKSDEEYVAVQACIDEVHFSDVFVVATANSLSNIPDSLLRAGRFDRKIRVYAPEGEDAVKIIRHYMSSKSFLSNINVADIAKMLDGNSCAELETILNEAAIYAGFERKEKITMKHIVRAVLRNVYRISNSLSTINPSELEAVAYHEAGHVVMSEVLEPDSVGLVSLRSRAIDKSCGFVKRCSEWECREHSILMSLAGKASTELKYGVVGKGVSNDLRSAMGKVSYDIMENATSGISAVDTNNGYRPSELLLSKQESIAHAQAERYMFKAKEILSQNREFVKGVVMELLKEKILLNSDIQRIKENCHIVA